MTPTNTDTEKGRGMGEMPELLPCPFCGGKDLTYRQDRTEGVPEFVYAYHVFCNDCHCHGGNNFPIGWCESEDAAADRWNLRGFKSHSQALTAHPTPSDTQEQG